MQSITLLAGSRETEMTGAVLLLEWLHWPAWVQYMMHRMHLFLYCFKCKFFYLKHPSVWNAIEILLNNQGIDKIMT